MDFTQFTEVIEDFRIRSRRHAARPERTYRLAQKRERPGARTPGPFQPASANSLINNPLPAKREVSMTVLDRCAVAPASSVTPTTGHLMDAPLDTLLAEFRVDVSVLPIPDRAFTGGTCVRKDGSMLFVFREGQPAVEREMIARAMLGQALRVPLPDLPDLYQLTEMAPSA